ncbi:TonB-dependent receptor domain-containing protein [Xanthomonas theicola]|uniref:TonB-dependent receptor-like beta-barrel domain-containing protein n=1 Tax=Xanthomonas theicola TaxID=56464 RepID=A0A2S6ZFU2_9XANT|nr:TonB-dependent receptor [Xanthomonas theicola]PPT91122.1 hypothetical protein XthCFBP4691_09040 [Xanthomonas theicola]QNH25433.1 TonB-dependent receptor [Xanthomonas theicola]
MSCWRCCGFLLVVIVASPVHAQRADDNAVTAVEDAFGATVGTETIGLYDESQVRGFSPVVAGNVRIEGLYMDRQGILPAPLVEGSTIRVGLAAQSFPFRAPTGIVDYKLHEAGNERIVSIVGALNAYDSPFIEVGSKLPIVRDRLSVAAGASYSYEKYLDGASAPYWRAAIVPRWHPTDAIEVIPFWSINRGDDEEVAALVNTSGNYLPPEPSRRPYFGQPWAQNETWSTNYGLITKARIGSNWAIAAGMFKSVYDVKKGFSELYNDTTPDGMTHELVIADPQQRYASTSGELRASRSFTEGPRLHVVYASVRERKQENRYGGSTEPFDFGVHRLGVQVVQPRPERFDFGERTRDSVDQSTLGLAYEGRWKGVGELSLGVQRVDYEKRVDQPNAPRVTRRDAPWLANGTLSAHLSQRLTLYGGYVRGLEENGIAPNGAVNRNEALPAIRSREMDAGLSWAVASDLKLIAGVFNIEKPYYAINPQGLYTSLGEVRHRGVELSLSGTPIDSLNVVAGAVLMSPRVSGELEGNRPIGQTDRTLRLNLEYRPPLWSGLAVDFAAVNYGDRTASLDGVNKVPGYTLLDLGFRYRLKWGAAPATLRVLAQNLTDEFAWGVFGPNNFLLTDGRRYSVQLAIDLY